MADATQLRPGSIVWLQAPDPQSRNPKLRAFVIIERFESLAVDDLLSAVAVTSTYREPVGPELIPMRWNARGTTETGFRRKCFAKLDWVVVLKVREGKDGLECDGVFEGKHIREQELRRIEAAIKKLQE